ncbi:trafficking protein particle complex subunit 8 isoform X6 [Sagmatias obliquidens]|uniref:trafficking protein particle complex subunit 8 isoform X6 n=1 Tax=Sagmatias obliquidens TaxID=3371155 RepID=UPI000F43F865|nr:trafficking protein particle complex subunit 8 isoform X6 [Lagenorhynchus obliquidens]
MAQCVQSVQELIPDSFVPCVAALCSDEAERLTRLNHLSFAELLKPFSRLTSEVHMRDPNNQLHVIKNLKIAVSNIITQPPQPGAIRKLLNDVVSGSQPAEGLVANVITAGDYDLNISATTPWFESYRETFLQSMPASDHEFLNHYLACMLVTSSSEAEPMEQFSKLSQEQHRIQHNNDYSYPKWFIPNTLKYYVLLHDVSAGDEQRAESIYEEMKQKYGTQGCYLLKINSRTPNRASDEQIPDPWSQYLQKNSIQNQESYEDGPCTITSNKNSDSNLLSLDGLDNEVKVDGLPNNFRTHPLQLDPSGDSSNSIDGPDHVKSASSLHETKKANAGIIHGACLTLTDHDRIRQFIQEFTFRGLLPHIEKTIRQLNDQLISRKGLSRSLFSATKKWFSGSKVPEKSINELKNTSGLLYPPEAPELQIRKMADLCFLVQHYDLAYSCYHTAKKDFLNDQAMLYAAGALEMAAVSAFLQPGAPRPYPAHYMDTAIQTYRDICKNMVLAERCVLLSAEILKSQSKYSEAAALLIRLTSEDSDLRSALLLEQAAHCFINMKSPMVRKYAFHMILAGHRFSKAGQKKHALRCYCQAMQVYKGKGWSLAEDHINFTIGRQSYTLRQLDNAVSAFRHILINESKQSAAQQGAFLREYLYVYKNVSQLSPDGPLPQLPLPYINSSATRVFFGHDRRPADGEKQAATHVSLDQEYDSESSQQWRELEEHVVAVVNRGVLPSNFHPTEYCLNRYSDNSRFPLTVVEEPITVEVAFRNPLKVPLLLTDLSLLWKFQPKDVSGKENEVKELVKGEPEMIGTEVVSEFLINSEESKVARLKLFPHHIGELHILGVVYNLGTIQGSMTVDGIGALPGCHTGKHSLSMSVRGRQDLEIQGPRLNNTKEEKTSIKYGPDRRLDPIITEEMPLLESEAGVKEFHIVQVSSSSKHWKLQKSVNLSENKDAKLANREKGKFCFKAIRCKEEEVATQSSEKYTFADIIFGNEQIVSSASPCADFFYRSLSSELKKPQAQSSLHTEKQSIEDTMRLIQKCNEVDLNIVVLWKAYVVEDSKQLILEGQHHVVLRTIGKEAFSYPQKQEPPEMELLKFFRPENTTVSSRPSVEQLSNLIRTSLHYPESFSHPFHQKSLCLVPVTLLLSNCSKADVDVIVDLRHKTTSPEALEIHGSFTWLGQTQYKLHLKSQELHSLQLKACFVHTGVYNLGTPRVFAKLSDQVTVFETSQQSSMPALIIINNV